MATGDIIVIALFIISAVVILLVPVTLKILLQGEGLLKQQIQKEFIATTLGHENFDPHTAVLVLESASMRYEAYRIYRSCEGEYFLYTGTTEKGSGYFTHLTKERAKAALFHNRKVFKKEFPNG